MACVRRNILSYRRCRDGRPDGRPVPESVGSAPRSLLATWLLHSVRPATYSLSLSLSVCLSVARHASARRWVARTRIVWRLRGYSSCALQLPVLWDVLMEIKTNETAALCRRSFQHATRKYAVSERHSAEPVPSPKLSQHGHPVIRVNLYP